MSEETQPQTPEEATLKPKKKGGKLPILIALVAVLGGGGFFGLKMKSGGKKDEPKIELGEIVTTREFLANLRDPESYVRTELAFHLRKDFTKETFATLEPGVRDAVNLILSSKTERDVASLEGKNKLKREIADAVNEVLLAGGQEHKQGPPQEGEGEEEPIEPAPIPKGWDSADGPVLKVYFTSFATQS
jgi:flagellar FliL protein